MDDIDRLLAELDNTQPQQPPSTPNESPAQSTAPIQSLDDLLSQLGEPEKRAVRTQLSQHPPKPSLPNLPVRRSPPVASSPASSPAPPPPRANVPPDDPLVAKLKSEHEAQSRAEQLRQEQERQEAELQRQREEREKQRRLDALRAERRAELAKQAQEWLKALKPRSDEGLWFNEFACNYESRLDAAIEYLEALQSVERESRR